MNVKWSLGVGGTIPWVFKNCFGHILVWMSFLACFTALLMDKRAGRFSPSGQKKPQIQAEFIQSTTFSP